MHTPYRLSLKSDNRYPESVVTPPPNHRKGNPHMHRTSFTVQVWDKQLELIKKAAKKENVSVMEYVRERIMPAAAEELGVPLPEVPEFRKGRPTGWKSVRKQAEELAGKDRWAGLLDEMARNVVKQLGSGAPAPQPIVRRKAH